MSSVGLAWTREALPNSWDKNDPKDAQMILHMLEIGAVQFFHDPIVVLTADNQELSKTHEIAGVGLRPRHISQVSSRPLNASQPTAPHQSPFRQRSASRAFLPI